MIAWVFPGQGSQKARMAARVGACHELFSAARTILGGKSLEKLCTREENPTWSPENLQPALFITEVGIGQQMLAAGLEPHAVAGHSLGEFPALVVAGALTFEDGLRLVAIRSRAMAAAGRRNPGGMAAVMGLSPAAIEQICAAEGDVWVSNVNSPKQTVISGKDRPLAQAAQRCLEAGAVRVVRIQVPLAAHCPLMEPARAQLESALAAPAGIRLRTPVCPVYSGVDAEPHLDPVEIASLLARSITSPVRFSETVLRMREDGIQTFVEAGPGKVLRALIRQIDPQATVTGVASDDEVANFGEAPPGGGVPRASTKPSRRITILNSDPALGFSS